MKDKEELKTLKDMKEKWGTNPNKQVNIIFKDLKANAVKWVKEDIEKFSLLGGIPEITSEWMKRLNITEEILK